MYNIEIKEPKYLMFTDQRFNIINMSLVLKLAMHIPCNPNQNLGRFCAYVCICIHVKIN